MDGRQWRTAGHHEPTSTYGKVLAMHAASVSWDFSAVGCDMFAVRLHCSSILTSLS